MPEIVVWSKPVCQQCKATYRTLDNAGIAYEIRNLEEHPEQLAAFKAQGLQSAPVVVAGDDAWAGFHPGKLGELVAQARAIAAANELVAA